MRLEDLKDGDVVYCPQHDGAFVVRLNAEGFHESNRDNQMCRCDFTKWRVVANVARETRQNC